MAEQNEFVTENTGKINKMPIELSNGMPVSPTVGTSVTEPHIQKSHVMMSNTVIEIKDLNIYFGPTHAVKSVNMSIRQNSVTAIIGPSGCGKSTLLRTLNRMHEISGGVTMTGSVVFEG